MKRFFFLFAILLVCQLHSQAQQAKRIVSLVPWVTKSLYLMGEQNRLVGCTSFCPVEASYKIPVVANAMSVNIEKTFTLKPDVVIASSLNKPETIENLKKLGIKVVLQPYPESFEEICTYFIQIGELVGQGVKAKAIVDQQKVRLAKLKASIPPGKNPNVFIQIGAKPLFCAVPNTFMEDFIRFSGGENIASELKLGSVTREYVLKQNPDVIFIVTMGIVAQEEKDTWLGYSALSASKSKKIFILDADKTCSPTPILFVDALEEMIKLMY
ncbi:MAG: ABC transporter substrate-binding protein [Prolixibacteraceae bacterium]|nr:ABC transporter substrate-binding protein [Prolixibacteraceae bacterium]